MSQQIQQLVEELIIQDNNYFNGTPVISDTEYDFLKRKLQELDPANPYLLTVGAAVRNVKTKLPYVMPSLDQKYAGEVESWVQKYNLSDQLVAITNKLDGVSASLIFNNGKLIYAFSRGDGFEGQDITRHVALANLPKTVAHTGYIAIRAELIMPISTFKTKYSTKFKNPRNLVAGVFNRKESDKQILKDIDVVVYEILEIKDSAFDMKKFSKQEMLQYLYNLRFDVVKVVYAKGNELNDDSLTKAIEQAKRESEYELDGIVITVDKWFDLVSQSQSQSINPEHSIKYKILDENAFGISEVVHVEWNKSKNGLLKPRVEIKPIELGGVTITFVTGHNAKNIFENGIGKGSIIKITRNGDVIPYIAGIISSTQPDLPTDVEWEWTSNDKGEQVEIALIDKNDPEVIFRQLLDFCTSLEVELLKEASLKSIFDTFHMEENDYTSNLAILFDLLPHEWESVLGVNGGKIHTSLHRRLQNLSMPILMGSLNYCGAGFGVRKAKSLLDQVSFDELVKMTINDIAELHGFDSKTATNIFNGVPQIVEFLNRFEDYLEFKKEEVKQTVLNGFLVVMTGFRDADLQKKIEEMGGKIGSSVSGKTTHLLQKDPSSESTKTKKAKEVGAKIMSPDQFKDQYNL